MGHENIDETAGAPSQGAPQIKVLKGAPTDAELAAVITVLAGLRGGPGHPGSQDLNPQNMDPQGLHTREINLWGHPVDKLRYPMTSWQRVTLLERTHMRR